MLINTLNSNNNSIATSIDDIPNYINYKALAYCIAGKNTHGNVRTAVNADKLIKKLITMQKRDDVKDEYIRSSKWIKRDSWTYSN